MFFLKSRSQNLLKDPLMLTLKEKDFADFLKANSHLPEAEQLITIRQKIGILGNGTNTPIYLGANNHTLIAGDSLLFQYRTFDRQTKSFGDVLLSFVPGTSQFSARITLASKLKALDEALKKAAPLVYKIAKSKEFTEQYAYKNQDSNSKVIHELLAVHPRLTKKWNRRHTVAATFKEIDNQTATAPVKKPSASKKHATFAPKLKEWVRMPYHPMIHNAPVTKQTLLEANQNLEKEFHSRAEETFNNAYDAYRNRLPYYYQEYKRGEYASYLNQCNKKKAEIDKIYAPKAKAARTTIIVGTILSPLILPLIAVGIGWWRSRKIEAKKAEKLAEYHTTLNQAAWEERNKDKLLNYDNWLATKTYSKEEFMLPTNETEEAQQAHKIYKQMKSQYDKAIENNFALAINFRMHGINAPKTLQELKDKTISSLLSVNTLSNSVDPAQKAPNNTYHLAATN